MTIEQLIDQLSTLGQTIGLKAEVNAWNIAERTNPMAPMGVRATSGVCAGWDKATQKPVATITLA